MGMASVPSIPPPPIVCMQADFLHAGLGRAWASNMTIVLRAGPGPHNSVCGPGPGRVCTTAAGPGRAWASNHICGPGLGLNFRPVQGPSCYPSPIDRRHVFSNRSVKQREDILTDKLAAYTHVIVRKTQIAQCAIVNNWGIIRWWAIMF